MTEKLPTKLEGIITQMNERIQNSEIAIESTKKDIEAQQARNEQLSKELELKQKMLQDFLDSRNAVIKEQVAKRVTELKKDAVSKKDQCLTKIAESEAILKTADEGLMKLETSVNKKLTKTKRLTLIHDEKKRQYDNLCSEIHELTTIKENQTQTLQQKQNEETEIASQINEYKSCIDGITNAKNVLTKMSKKESPAYIKPKKETMPEAKPVNKKVEAPIDDEFWFEQPKPPSSKQVAKPKAKQKKKN